MMKRYRRVLLVLLVAMVCGGCGLLSDGCAITGIENFSPSLYSLGLTANLFPSEDFLTRFPYESASFDYYDTDSWTESPDWGVVRTIAVLRYSPEDYAQAKAFCMEQFVLSRERQLAHGGFTFAENNTYGAQHTSVDWGIPKHFNLFGWQDESCELMFLGYYGSAGTAMDMLPEDFSGFMEAVFGRYYDFQPDTADGTQANFLLRRKPSLRDSGVRRLAKKSAKR